MEDNKIQGLNLPLEYLDLPDDELPLPQEDEVEAITAVQNLDSADGYAPLDEVTTEFSAPEQLPDAQVPVYGINLRKDNASGTPAKRLSPALITGIAAAAVVLICGLIFVPHILASREPEPLLQARKPIEQPEPEPEPVPGLTANDILPLVGALQYNGENVSLAADRLSIGIRDGRLVVTHTLGADEQIDATALAVTAAKRSTALAAQLTDTHLATQEGEEGKAFAGLTWIVRAQDGANYLAIAEAPGELRAGNDITLLAGANGYTLSQSLYDALGGTDSGIAQSFGTMPTDLDGKNVEVTATLPEPEPAEEETAEETTDEAVEETYDNSGEYYYEETTYEYTPTNDTDTTPQQVIPVYPVPDDTSATDDEPQAYVVPDEETEPTPVEEPTPTEPVAEEGAGE